MSTNIMSPSRTAVPPAQYRVANMYGLPVRKLKDILEKINPQISLDTVEELEMKQLARLYLLHILDGKSLFLAYSPSLSVRLLRHETSILHSEALLLHFLAGCSDETASLSRSVSISANNALFQLLPKLLKHSADSRELAMPYNLFLAHPLTSHSTPTTDQFTAQADKLATDKQLGLLCRALASCISPSSIFGPAIQVLPDPNAPINLRHAESKGPKSWSVAFNSLWEGVLRDGEDMSVLLPYESIRMAYLRLAWRLDAVLVPRLFIMDVSRESNVVCAKSDEGASIVGLRSWSQGVFGDPLLAEIFESPSEKFMEGWKEGGEEVIEDAENAHVRRILYRCFRATVEVVTQYYRPSGESCREMEARRKLTNALAELEKIDIATGGL